MKRILILLVLGSITTIMNGQTKEVHKMIFFDSGEIIPTSSIDYIFKELNETIDFKNITKIVIKGHTDNIGSIPSNQLLSEMRSKSVYKRLLNFDIAKEIITTEGYSELKPLKENTTPELRAQNRRVEISIWYNDEKEITQSSLNTVLELDTILTIDEAVFIDENETIATSNCHAFFSGALLSDNQEQEWTAEIFVEDEFSQHVAYGEYPNNEVAFQKASENTLDGLAVNEGTRIVIYKKPNFQGRVLLDINGPAIVNNLLYKVQRPEIKKKTFKSRLQDLFPPSKRNWSKTNMHRWKKGSMKIICEES